MKGNPFILFAMLLLAVLSAGAQPLDCQVFQSEYRAAATSAEISGNKRVLWYRLAYAGDSREPASSDAAEAAMITANAILSRISFGKVSLTWNITPLLQLPRTTGFYSTNVIALVNDARTCAAQAGFDLSAYDRDLVSPPPMAGWMQGMAPIGGKWLYVSVAHGGLVVHELGHTFGLPHANAWDTNCRPDPFQKTSPPFPSNIASMIGDYKFETNSFVGRLGIMFPGNSIEYGDAFDIMATSATNADFNVNFKTRIGWIPAEAVKNVSSNGLYRIYSQRTNALTGGLAYALAIEKPVVGRQSDGIPRQYWVEAAPLPHTGVTLRWIDVNRTQPSLLLDTTLNTFTSFGDAPLTVALAFDDPGLGLSITPIASGFDGAGTWIDVRIEFNAGNKAAKNPPSVPDLPGTNLITGRVTDTSGHPLANCRIQNGRITRRAGDRGDFGATETDSQGYYTLYLDNAWEPYTVGASIYGYRLAPGFADQTVTIPASGIASNIDFVFEPLPRVIVTAPPQLIEGQTGAFTISRTGNTTAPLDVVWHTTGTADISDYFGPSGVGRVTIPAGSSSTTIPVSAIQNDSFTPSKTLTLHAVIPSSTQTDGVTYFYPGWELRAGAGEQKWFQTDPPYATFADSAATITLLDNSDPNAFQVRLVNGDVGARLEISAPIGQFVRVEASADLSNWLTIGTNMIKASPFRITLPQPPDAVRFYRARLVTP